MVHSLVVLRNADYLITEYVHARQGQSDSCGKVGWQRSYTDFLGNVSAIFSQQCHVWSWDSLGYTSRLHGGCVNRSYRKHLRSCALVTRVLVLRKLCRKRICAFDFITEVSSCDQFLQPKQSTAIQIIGGYMYFRNAWRKHRLLDDSDSTSIQVYYLQLGEIGKSVGRDV